MKHNARKINEPQESDCRNAVVIIRADSSSTIGTGHIMRCLGLAQRELKAYRVIFAVRNLPGHIYHKIDEAGFEKLFLKSDDIEELAETVTRYGAETVVIDHYGIDWRAEKKLKIQTGATLFVLDDIYERHHCDILLNHNIYADMGRYKDLVPEYCKVLCGKEHTLIRSEFYKAKEDSVALGPREKIHLFVAMGGADTAQLNIPILQALSRIPQIHAHVVTTKANPGLKTLKEYVQKCSNATLYVDTDQIAQLMAGSDLAIVTPSVVLNEVFFMGLPFIAVQTASNQKLMVEYLHKNNYFILTRFDSTQLLRYLRHFIAKELTTLKNFIDLSFCELKKVLSWRNEKSVRQWMFHTAVITWPEHMKFIEHLKVDTTRYYFLVYLKSYPIGVVDLTNIDRVRKSAEIGIYADPTQRGLGKFLLDALLYYSFESLKLKSLKARVFEKNEKAKRLYRLVGFEMIDQEKYQQKVLLHMLLPYKKWINVERSNK